MFHSQITEAIPYNIVGISIDVSLSNIFCNDVCGEPEREPPSECVNFTTQIIIFDHPGKIHAGYSPLMSKEAKLVLHDEEICLYDIDYECTKDGRWLRDTIFYFHFRCLERKYNILFNDHYFRIFNTQITQIIQNFSFEFANEAIPHVNLSQYKLIFFPLSDFNPKTQSANYNI